MDSHYYTPQIYTQAQNSSKVYINPNFQRNISPNAQNTSVHLNPLFSHHTNIQQTAGNKSKIYVNPNFVKTNINVPPPSTSQYFASTAITVPPSTSQYLVSTSISQNSFYPAYTRNSVATSSAYDHANHNIMHHYAANVSSQYSAPIATYISSPYTLDSQNVYVTSNNHATTSQQSLPSTTPTIVSNKITTQSNLASTPVTKSRYAIVRKNNIKTKEFEPQADEKKVTKLKINKYKTVSLDQAKKNMQTEKPTQKVNLKVTLPQTSTPVLTERNKSLKIMHSRFKLVKKISSTSTMEIKTPVRRRQSLNSSKIIVKTKNTTSRIQNKKKFKLNNIPCPLFKKFGKCLRADKGTCDFLHDKKHVSICRKFLKGACHDKECLLSHELTAKKMPTCYFYLKRMCTKEDCPYLHVKLNDKAKVCLDFLNGYCERGDKCLKRHINICPELASKGSCSRKQCSYSHGSNKKTKLNKSKTRAKTQSQSYKIKHEKKKINRNRNEGSDELRQCGDNNSEQKDTTDCRYYKDLVENESDTGFENIKPSRCKLGDLPSFIGL